MFTPIHSVVSPHWTAGTVVTPNQSVVLPCLTPDNSSTPSCSTSSNPPSFSITNWGNASCLPKFSLRVQEVLAKGAVIEEWDTFISECAYHILANGDMKDKTMYSDFGRAIVQCYPCVGNPDGQQLWVCASCMSILLS